MNEISVSSLVPQAYEVYVNAEDGDVSILKLKHVASTGVLEAGYHTIKLNNVKLTGQKFVVAVKYISQNGSASIGVSEGYTDSYTDSNSIFKEMVPNFIESEGQYFKRGRSYVGTSLSNMKEISEANIKIGNTSYNLFANVCIKAFTTGGKEEITTRTGYIAFEDYNDKKKDSAYRLFCIQHNVHLPSRDDGSKEDATVESGGKKETVEEPQEGQQLFFVHKEDGETENIVKQQVIQVQTIELVIQEK